MTDSKLIYRPIKFGKIPRERRGRLDSLIMRSAGKIWGDTLTNRDAQKLYDAWTLAGKNAFPGLGARLAEELKNYLDRQGIPYQGRIFGSGKGKSRLASRRPLARGFRSR
jgi:hypothetical protein